MRSRPRRRASVEGEGAWGQDLELDQPLSQNLFSSSYIRLGAASLTDKFLSQIKIV